MRGIFAGEAVLSFWEGILLLWLVKCQYLRTHIFCFYRSLFSTSQLQLRMVVSEVCRCFCWPRFAHSCSSCIGVIVICVRWGCGVRSFGTEQCWRVTHHPEDGSNIFCRNIGIHLRSWIRNAGCKHEVWHTSELFAEMSRKEVNAQCERPTVLRITVTEITIYV